MQSSDTPQADRYWEFEDGSVNLTDPRGGPAAITMMLALEYELVASNDWFHVPLELDYGFAFQLDLLRVTDTFGIPSDIARASAGPGGWAMFELSRRSDGTRSPDLFVLPAVTADILESAPVEEVHLFRDEMANLVWGVEKRTIGLTVEPIDRTREATGATLAHQRAADPTGIDAPLLYRLQSTVAPNWFPFLPESDPDGVPGVVILTRRDLHRVTIRPDGQVDESALKPLGRILRGPDGQLSIDENEVPRSGLILTRTFQHARTADGRRVVWLGRRKRVGRGEGWSDLRYDILEPTTPRQ